jgi:hypothetical protein
MKWRGTRLATLIQLDTAMPDHDAKRVQCPKCAAPIDEFVSTCWTCGHQIDANAATSVHSETESVDQIPLVDWKESEPAALNVPAREAVPATTGNQWSLALVGGAGVLACATAFVILQSLQPAASPQPVASVEVPAPPAPVVAVPVVETAPPPTWVGARRASWANDGSKTISFELQATGDVDVWMSRVRPLLVVRCLYRTTEVFVATRSAASIEGRAGSHTVRLYVDDDPELVQQWSDSDSGQELFAPNGVALTRRLATAKRLRFGFTPYNAKPVTAEFAVEGFDKLAALVGNACGWKVDESRSSPARTARLN